MFKSKTVLVVGAGASAEVGLPIGVGLKEVIAKKLDIKFPDGYTQEGGDRKIYEAYKIQVGRDGGHDPNDYRTAGVKMSESLPLAISIDNYLEAHAGNSKVELCGKLAIVQSILEAERQSSFYVDHRRGHELDLSNSQLQGVWYMALIRALTEGVAKTDLDSLFSNLSFVIFNYDRCVETFLHRALQVYFDTSAKVIESLLANVTFLHPYGVIGRLPWQSGAGPQVEYGAEVAPLQLLDLASGIRTFSERVASGDFLDQLRSEMASADTVAYLGFSFHPQNMELLEVDGTGRVRRVYGTALAISASDRNVVMKSINRSLKPTVTNLSIELPDITCAKLFSEFSRSITQ